MNFTKKIQKEIQESFNKKPDAATRKKLIEIINNEVDKIKKEKEILQKALMLLQQQEFDDYYKNNPDPYKDEEFEEFITNVQLDGVYIKLINQFPLVPIKTHAQYKQARIQYDDLETNYDLNSDIHAEEYYQVLGRLLEDYENENFSLEKSNPIDTLKSLFCQFIMRKRKNLD